MARGLDNWTPDDLRKFIKTHDFHLHKQLSGSHEAWIDKSGGNVVEVNITKSSYPPRTLETMIGQSGVEKSHWKKWTTLNKGQQKKRLCCKTPRTK